MTLNRVFNYAATMFGAILIGYAFGPLLGSTQSGLLSAGLVLLAKPWQCREADHE